MARFVIRTLAVAILAWAILGGASEAQSTCATTSCNVDTAQCSGGSGGGRVYCCCSVTTQISGNQVIKTCNKFCARDCNIGGCSGAINCETCNLNSGAMAFIITPQVSDRIFAQDIATAAILTNINKAKDRGIRSQHTDGVVRIGERPMSYRARITATPALLTIEFLYFDVPGFTTPPHRRVEIDATGNVVETPLPAPDVENIRTWAPKQGSPGQEP